MKHTHELKLRNGREDIRAVGKALESAGSVLQYVAIYSRLRYTSMQRIFTADAEPNYPVSVGHMPEGT